MELLSKEILEQIRQAKAEREAAKAEAVETKAQDDDEDFDPIRDIEVDADPEMESKRGMWQASW